jgi:hypothetical protein
MSDLKAGDKIYAVYDSGFGTPPAIEVAVITKVTPKRIFINREGWEKSGYCYAGLAFNCRSMIPRDEPNVASRYLHRTPKAAWQDYLARLKASREALTEKLRVTSDKIQKTLEIIDTLED